MIIGVDIDGVLTKLYAYCVKKSKEFFKKEKSKGEKFKKSTCLYQLLGMTKEQDKRFWKEYIWDYSKEVKFYKHASKFLNKLREAGHQIYIITLRQYFGTGDENSVLMENIIKETFANNGIGGKVEKDEEIEHAMIRETQEEIGVTPKNYTKKAVINFDMFLKGEPTYEIMHVYVASDYEGTVSESDEMKPRWFEFDEIPYDNMFAADKIWMKKMFDGEEFSGDVKFDENFKLISYNFD